MNAKEFNKIIKNLSVKGNAEKLYDNFYANTVRFVAKYFGKSVAEDVTQALFLDLLKNGADLPPVEYPQAWMFRCAYNRAINVIRHDSRCLLVPEVEPDLSTEDFSLDEKMLLGDAITKLTDEERKIIYMRLWDGFDYAEISDILGIDMSLIRQKYRRAIKKLKNFSN